MGVIYKYELEVTDEQEVAMPDGAKILSVHVQHKAVMLWCLCSDPDAKRVRRRIGIYGTGKPCPNRPGEFIGTVQLMGGSLVFHVFELK